MLKSIPASFKYLQQWKHRIPLKIEDEENVEGKIIVITGANDGIGKGTAVELAKRGATIVMACRDIEKGQKVLEEIKTHTPNGKSFMVKLDLGELSSVRSCAKEIITKVSHINILINNAGVMYFEPNIRKCTDGIEIHMGINHLGHFLFTLLLLEHLKKGTPGRIIILSSFIHQAGELNTGDLLLEKRGSFGLRYTGAYSNSKLANLYFTKSLSKLLLETGINVYALCPGVINTGLYKQTDWITTQIVRVWKSILEVKLKDGVEGVLYCTLSKTCATESGEMYQFNHICKNIMSELDNEIEKKLWQKSCSLVGLSFPMEFDISKQLQLQNNVV